MLKNRLKQVIALLLTLVLVLGGVALNPTPAVAATGKNIKVGKTLVVYEDIVDLDGVQAAVENNLYNESQSIHLPADVGWRIKGDANMKFIRSGRRTGMIYDLYAAFPFAAVSELPFPQKKLACPIWYDTGIQQD